MNPLVHNPISALFNIIRSGNPMQIAQNMLSQDPAAQAMLKSCQNQCGSGDPKEFVLNMCRERGMDLDQVMSAAKMLGLK